MGYDITSIRPAEVWDLDISEFLGQKEPVIIQIKHFTNWQNYEITTLGGEGQEYDSSTGRILLKNTKNMEKIFIKEMVYGVVIETCPFTDANGNPTWNEKFIREIDNISPQLVEYIHNHIKELNSPLARRKQNE